ncbi:hypothetical protein GCM10010400_76680 [Streptomyces aculeolatus]
MVTPEVAALASTGATTLVGLMVTDGWTQARARFTRLLQRRGSAVETELETTRSTLLAMSAADSDRARAEAENTWAERLTLLLSSDPEAVSELAEILTEYPRSTQTHAEIHGGVFHGPVQMGGTQTNHFGRQD